VEEHVRSTVVVVTWRGRAHVASCLDALAAQDRPHRTLVVDNASDDGSADVLAAHPTCPDVLRLSQNIGYAGGMAAALEHIRTPYVAWLNDDAAPAAGWLSALEDALDADERVAAVSSVLCTPDGRVQSIGVRLTADGHGADVQEGDVFGFCGGAALLRTDRLRAIGGVPAEFFCYYEDTDTAWRLRLGGHRLAAVPTARATHLHGASTRPGSARFHRWNERNRLLMLLRCAPADVAAREFARFAAITLALPLRRTAPKAANFRVALRLRVLAEVVARLPATLRARRRIGRIAAIPRRTIWRQWTRPSSSRDAESGDYAPLSPSKAETE
jgi:GT2 family glycosyltransferase